MGVAGEEERGPAAVAGWGQRGDRQEIRNAPHSAWIQVMHMGSPDALFYRSLLANKNLFSIKKFAIQSHRAKHYHKAHCYHF